SERARAASMKTFRLPLAADWPTNSDRVWGRRARSYCSPGAGAGEMMRSSVMRRPSPSQLLQGRADDQRQFGVLAQLDQGVIDSAAGVDLGDAQAQQGGDRLARDAGRRRGDDGGLGVDARRGRSEDALAQAL